MNKDKEEKVGNLGQPGQPGEVGKPFQSNSITSRTKELLNNITKNSNDLYSILNFLGGDPIPGISGYQPPEDNIFLNIENTIMECYIQNQIITNVKKVLGIKEPIK